MNILNIFTNEFAGLEEAQIRTKFKELVHVYHPDKGGDTKLTILLIEAYKEALKGNNPKINLEIEKDLLDKLDQILKLDGVIIELIGVWIWVTGKTKENKEELKKAQFRYSPVKSAWYYRKEVEGKTFYNGSSTLDEIRGKYKTSFREKTPNQKKSLA